MATITLQLNIATTVATLDAPSIAAIIAWVQTNIISKLPAGSTVNVQQYVINP
jgi:hypothetical protein